MAELRHDPRFLGKLRIELDKCYEQMAKGMPTAELTHRLQVLRDYFIFLTLDALKDPALTRKLTHEFRRLQRRTRTHPGFFIALSQLLSLKYSEVKLPLEMRSRKYFIRSFERIANKRKISSERI